VTQKIVITDWTFPDLSLEEELVKANGAMLVGKQCQSATDLISLVADADAVMTQFARIDAGVIARCVRRASAYATASAWTTWTSMPPASATSRLQRSGLLRGRSRRPHAGVHLATTRQVGPNTLHLRAGKWDWPRRSPRCRR